MRAINRLDNATVRNLKRPGRYADGGGLYLQVSALPAKDGISVTKSWLFRYQLRGRNRAMGLGAYPDTSLAEARDDASDARKLCKKQKIDPIDAKRAKEDAEWKEATSNITFKEAVAEFYNEHAANWRSRKHAEQWIKSLNDLTALTPRPVHALDDAVINTALQPISARTHITAQRIGARVRRVVQWVKAGKPLARKNGTKKHQPALPYERMAEFMAELQEIDSIPARALELLILTATRAGEIRGARWSEINMDKATWVIPADRMNKTGREHRIPLSAQAVDLLKALPRERGNPLVFVSAVKGRPIEDKALQRVMGRMNAKRAKAGMPLFVDPKQDNRPATPHGFRSTFRDWASERTSYPHAVVEQALAHTVSNAVERAYHRTDLLEKRRRLMADWARYCSTPAPASGTVTPISRRPAA